MIDKAIFGYLFARSGMFFAQGLPVVFLQKLLGGSANDVPSWPKERIELVDRKVRDFLMKDAQQFQAGIYPYGLLAPEPPLRHAFRFSRIVADSVRVALRRKGRQHNDIPEQVGATHQTLPDYFKRNFHFQTDGYLSAQSADLYTHQVEILFKGTAAAMRRLVLRGMEGVVQNPTSILDIACGEGVSTQILAAKYPEARIVGLDISPQYIKKAQQRGLSNVDFVQGAAESLLYRDGSFDCIASTYLFHEIPNSVRQAVLSEIHRVLKTSGTVHLVDSLQWDDDPELNWALERFPLDFHEPFYKNYMEGSLEKDLQTAGFKVLRTDIGFLTKSVTAVKIER